MGLQETMRALSDPTRREILEHLREGRLAAGEIAARFPVSNAAVSKHLAVLREAGLVRDIRSGKHDTVSFTPLTNAPGSYGTFSPTCC